MNAGLPSPSLLRSVSHVTPIVPSVQPPSTDWVAMTDPGSGQTYYYNNVTGESSWVPPPQFGAGRNSFHGAI